MPGTTDNDAMVDQALNDIGKSCHGVTAIEIWLYGKDDGKLTMIQSWVDPEYCANDKPGIQRALKALYDPTSYGYDITNKEKLVPGEGLAGALWSDTGGKPITIRTTSLFSRIFWRDVKGLAIDPDQPPNDRLPVLVEAGFRFACGVPFKAEGVRGIVIFLAPPQDNMNQLKSRLNEEIILEGAEHIGCIQVMGSSDRPFDVEQIRKSNTKDLWKIVKLKYKEAVFNKGKKGSTKS